MSHRPFDTFEKLTGYGPRTSIVLDGARGVFDVTISNGMHPQTKLELDLMSLLMSRTLSIISKSPLVLGPR